MISHDKLTEAEQQGVCDLLARRLVNRLGIDNTNRIPESWWALLCGHFLDRVVVRGHWHLPEALKWADGQVTMYLRRLKDK